MENSLIIKKINLRIFKKNQRFLMRNYKKAWKAKSDEFKNEIFSMNAQYEKDY